MIFWKGHGILILMFGVIGAVAGTSIGGFLHGATHWEWIGRMRLCWPLWGAAAAIWLYARTVGKTTQRVLLDPATQRRVLLESSHTLYFLSGTAWAVLVTLMAGFASVMAVMLPSSPSDFDGMAAESGPGANAFEQANHLISMDKGQEAYGNTPDAERMAADFARMVKLGRQMGVQAGKKSTVSLSHGKFLTYCRVNADSCAFMVHVPDLRKFSKDAKEYIAEVAWAVATESAAHLKPQPKRLAIGVRGAFLYDTVIEGHIVADDKDPEEGIEQRHTGGSPQKYLESFFEPGAGNAALSKLGAADEPEKMAAKTALQMATPSATPGGAPSKSAMSPKEKVDMLLKGFTAIKPGEVAGNADAVNQLALKYAGFVHERVSVNPALGGMTLPDPCFSAYVHLRDDTAAFLLALPAGSDLSPDALTLIEREAWGIAAMASAQMSPMPVRIAVVTFKEGQMDLTRIGSPRNQQGTEWLVEQELAGKQGTYVLAPFVAASSQPLITVKSPLTLQASVKSLLPASPPVRTAPPARAAPALVPASAPLLPTPVRDWKDATGRLMQASLESFTTPAKDTGRVKRADGQAFDVPFSRLSAEDQAYIRSIAQKLK
jgi:hypothetical protein